ncbi:MAG: sulfite oxidase-like oxidoreductase [Pseudomonadota bacterium]
MPDWKKLIAAKTKQARRRDKPPRWQEGARVPPGQHLVENFPVLDLGVRPKIAITDWRLRLFGLVEQEVTLDWAALQTLPQSDIMCDFHCVTTWSQLDMPWRGVHAREVIELARPLPDAHFVTLHSYDDYTTNLPLEALLEDDVLIAHSVYGQPLSAEHGGPVRLLVPSRYGWKSAKWLKAIEFHQHDRPGFWEERGYHDNADPWREQRYR